MIIKIKDVNINYVRYGKKEKPAIVFLHGWGQNIEMMTPLGDARKEKNDVVSIDLPGFGRSEEPKYAWQLMDYVDMLKELFDKLNIINPILVGHSFGGRISLAYASMYNVDKMILFGSPFKKEVTTDSFKTKLLKTAKKIPLLNNL